MARDLWQKIEWIREQPEHVRMRYVAGCLFVSMIFIVGLWLLSLQESFQSIRRDVPVGIEKGKEMLPDDSALSSVNSLLEQQKPLGVDMGNEKTGQQYFEEQFGAEYEKGSAGE